MNCKFIVGNKPRVKAFFLTPAGVALDPTAVKFRVSDPEGTETEYVYGVGATLVRDAAGQYHVDVDCSLVGKYYCRWEATGTGQCAAELTLEITSDYPED